MSGYGEKLINYNEFVIQWNAFAQVKQFMDALEIKGMHACPWITRL
jgi:hypothetical protein